MSAEPMRYCDLVMKGGITSGIVYPNAILALAQRYRFKNIGGTSAGAIAAAATAAAALGDRRKQAGQKRAASHMPSGFQGLAGIAKLLATQGFIYSLFQPASGARAAYRLIVTLTGTAPVWRKTLAPLHAILVLAPLTVSIVIGGFLALGWLAAGASGVLAALLPSLICAGLAGGIAAAHRIARVVRHNQLGLCSGRISGHAKPGLTDWLHQVLQQLAGMPADRPLLFRDLWNAPRYPEEPATSQALTLRMITTCVSHHEPRSLPFEDATFWFREDEMRALFPEAIVTWLIAKAPKRCTIDSTAYHQLPHSGDLPVLVATRMSLSFPLLISAVPLHEAAARGSDTAQPERSDPVSSAPALDATDQLAAGGVKPRDRITAFRRLWFSDGGIASNFPLHLFDAPLPQWPTFAINLVYPGSADNPGQPVVHLPTENNQGWQRKYESFAQPGALRELIGFAGAIVATMQNWRDLLQARAPGHRDRIVHVSLASDEGGMNLDMPQAILDAIAAKGEAAGAAFEDFSFANHHWVRWRNLAAAWQRCVIRIGESVTRGPQMPVTASAIATATSGAPRPPSYRFQSLDDDRAARDLLEALVQQGTEWEDLGPDWTKRAPRALPELRITPTY